MRHLLTTVLLVLLIAASVPDTSYADQMQNKYYQDVAKYYDYPFGTILNLVEMGISNEDMPVVLYIADRSKTDYREVAQMRAEGESFSNVLSFIGLKNEAFFIIVNSKFKSKTFAPIFEKFKTTPKARWNTIDFSDDEIINLVNLKFVSSHHDYSIFDIMAMRDFGKPYTRINQQVSDIKVAMAKELKTKQYVDEQ